MVTNNFALTLQQIYMGYMETEIRVVCNDAYVNILTIKVYNETTEITYNELSSGTITFVKADGTTVQGNLAINASNITYTMGTNEIAISGSVRTSIQLYGSLGERLTPARFKFYADSDLSSESAAASTTNLIAASNLAAHLADNAHVCRSLTSDITSTLQAAINAGYNKILIPQGDFLLSNTVLLASNLELEISKGCTLKLIDNAPFNLRVLDARNCDNVHIFGGGTLDLNSAVQPANQKNHGISLTSKGVLIEDITIKNVSCYLGSMGDGINCAPNNTTLKQCENITIIHCYFDNIGRQDIALESGINVLIDGNLFENGLASAVDCEPGGNPLGLVDGVIFSNNVCKNKTNGFASVSSEVPTKLQNITICNNHFYLCSNVIMIRWAKHILITGNKFIDSAGTYTINLYADDTCVNEDINIYDNSFTGANTYGIYTNAIGTGVHTNVRIVNNTISETLNPIRLDYCSNLIVQGNACKLTSVNDGIYVNSGTNIIVKNNKVDGGTSSLGIRITNSMFIEIGQNTLFNVTTGILLQVDANIFWTDNTHYNNSTANFIDSGTNTLWHGTFNGTFTMIDTDYRMNVDDRHVEVASLILLIPTNKDAMAVMASTKAMYVSDNSVVNTTFRVETSDSSNVVGTPTFSYTIINP